MNTVRRNLAVSPDTDQAVRTYLAGQGGGRKGDLSRFIDAAVRAHILERSAEQAEAADANANKADLTAIATEAVEWSRSREPGCASSRTPASC